MLWELVLLGEPLVVMAPSPSESSETVLALVKWVYWALDADTFSISSLWCSPTHGINPCNSLLRMDEKIDSGSVRARTMFLLLWITHTHTFFTYVKLDLDRFQLILVISAYLKAILEWFIYRIYIVYMDVSWLWIGTLILCLPVPQLYFSIKVL